MSNARLSILQARAVKDRRISDAQFRTLAALGMYGDEDGWCFPKLETIGKDLGKSKQAVGRDTIALRKLGYLDVYNRYDKENGVRKSNLYRLRFDLPPLPSQHHVDTLSTPDVDVNVPVNTPSNARANSVIRATMPLDWQLGHSDPVDPEKISEELEREALRVSATASFEKSLGFGVLPWSSSSVWEKLERFVVKVYKQNPAVFEEFQAWRETGRGQYKGWTNGKIRTNPQVFIDSALPEFEASRMYAKPGEKAHAL